MLRGGCLRISSIGNIERFWDRVMSGLFVLFLT